MSKSIPLQAGQKFGRLTVISSPKILKERDSKRIRKRIYYLCKCDCGKVKLILSDNLSRGLTKSCGCLSAQIAKERFTKHGLGNTRLYRIWRCMKQRCFDKNAPVYARYGKRGITICDEWKNDFMSFYNWAIANGYKDNLTIDRINNDGNYEPENCRWANVKMQARNKRNNRMILYKGESHCVAEWAEIIGVPKNVLFARIYRGLSIEDSFKCKPNTKYISYKGEKHSIAEWCRILNLNSKRVYYRLEHGCDIKNVLENIGS